MGQRVFDVALRHHGPSLASSFSVILHFGAVDYETTVFVNGQKVGSHVGGYDKFSFDVTPYLNKRGDNELIVFAYDATDAHGARPIGKQRTVPSHIWYTVSTSTSLRFGVLCPTPVAALQWHLADGLPRVRPLD